MTDNPSQSPQDTQAPETAGVRLRLVRGHATPEELCAVIAIVAVAAAGADSGTGPADRSGQGGGTSARSLWGSPARMVRVTHPHGPGGWRASASAR